MTAQDVGYANPGGRGGTRERTAQTLIKSVETLADVLGREIDPWSIGEELSQEWSAQRLPADFPDLLARLSTRVGLRLNAASVRVADLLRVISPSAPMLVVVGTGEAPECLIMAAARRRRLRVYRIAEGVVREENLSLNRLIALLGCGAQASVDGLVAQPAATLDAADAAHAGQKPTPFRRLVRMLWPERRDLLNVVVFAIGVGVLTLATPIAVQALVNIVAFGGLIQPLVVLALLLLGFLVFAGAIQMLQWYVVEIIQRRFFVRVVSDLGYRLPRVRLEAFSTSHGPELVNRFFDVLTVQKVGATLMLDGVAAVLQTAIGLLVLAFYHPVFLAFDVCLLGAIALIVFVLGRGAVATAVEESKSKYAVAASLEEIARNPMTFKLSGGPLYALRRADQLAGGYLRARRRHFAIVLRQMIGAVSLYALASTALLALGGWLVMKGQLTLGQLVAAELIVAIVLAAFTKLGKKLESYYDLLAAVDKLGQLIDLPLERRTGESPAVSSNGAALAIRDLSFRFKNGAEVFRGLRLDLKPGEKIAILGPHGSGKSTLADLLYGGHTPMGGAIELDGVDLRDWHLDTLRRHVAVVKGLEIVEGSVADNVHLHRPGISMGAVREALRQVGLLQEIQAMPDGLSTLLTSSGAPLSFGQARRLMLARAIVLAPRLLVLDDLLDDVDPINRRQIQACLLSTARPWTLIVLSRNEQAIQPFARVVRISSATDPSAADELAVDTVEIAGDGPAVNATGRETAFNGDQTDSIKRVQQ